MLLDLLALAFGLLGWDSGSQGNAWSHGLLMAGVWSALAGGASAWLLRDRQTGMVLALIVFSHWILDWISHPIPLETMSWSRWQWTYGAPLPPDLPLLLAGSPRVGLGLYNAISAGQATAIELAMLAAGAVLYRRGATK